MDSKNLLDYLQKVLTLERDNYMQHQTLKAINNTIVNYKNKIENNQKLLEKEVSYNSRTHQLRERIKDYDGVDHIDQVIRVDKSGKWLAYFGIYYCAFLGGMILGIPTLLITNGKTLPSVLLGFLGVLIGGYFPLKAWRKTLKKREQAEIKKIEALQLQDDVNTIKRYDENTRLSAMLPKLENDYNAMIKVNKVTINTLNKFYALNIIPNKYRSFVPVSMFYDYILNKRTYSLERNPVTSDIGAINLYEDEKLKNIIITELRKMNRNLEAIREGQQILYAEIKQANAQTHQLLRDINSNITDFKENVKQDMSVIKYQTEQISKCSQYMSYVTYQNYMS